ncbi:3-deoxy-D-manno-octulosonate 8-phosphate phosphatase [Lachnospiraceae bacterium OttesenSCG-928-D06]|nr:3-deoxy-D-manno-octulosonate 8-phosphate phosphatase [Lachnospiraceae bacterium OttesenSCG-928-D06]
MVNAIVIDVDGTLTDGRIYLNETGEEFKVFSTYDGYAIKDILPQYGIIPIVISARNSVIVNKRCEELNIKYCYQGCNDKTLILREIANKLCLPCGADGIFYKIAYIGDDLADFLSMKLCGIVGCPSNAVKEIKEILNYITHKSGGDGAVREFINWLVSQREI